MKYNKKTTYPILTFINHKKTGSSANISSSGSLTSYCCSLFQIYTHHTAATKPAQALHLPFLTPALWASPTSFSSLWRHSDRRFDLQWSRVQELAKLRLTEPRVEHHQHRHDACSLPSERLQAADVHRVMVKKTGPSLLMTTVHHQRPVLLRSPSTLSQVCLSLLQVN